MTNNTYKPPFSTAVIPVGGHGTRMGESTRAVPKALLPIGGKPLIIHAVDEAINAGVSRVIILCRPDEEFLFKRQFEHNSTREQNIVDNGRNHLLDEKPPCDAAIEVIAVYEKEGPASSIARLVKEREIGAFGVILPDDLLITQLPALKQLMDNFDKSPMTMVGARQARLDIENTNNVTFVKTEALENGMHVTSTVQIKPAEESPVSQNATCGRYVFGPDFVQMVDECDKTGLKEVSMSTVVRHYAENGGVGVAPLDAAQYFDCGDPGGYMRAQAAFMCPNILSEMFMRANPAVSMLSTKPDEQPSVDLGGRDIG